MKRLLSILLIALLLVPLAAAQADQTAHIYIDDGLLTEEELQSLEARAQEIADTHKVGVYFVYIMSIDDILTYADRFMAGTVTEENAVALFVNEDYYHFAQKGATAEAVFPSGVCESTLWEAFRSVSDDNYGKVLAYYDAADELLQAYRADPETAPAAAETAAFAVPEYIARTKGGKPTLYDSAQLLSASEAEALSKRLLAIGDAYRCDVVIATVPSLGYKSAEAYADDFFDYNGYGYGATPDGSGTTRDGDGVLLLLSMEDRDFAISTSGYGITAFTDYGIQIYLENAFLPYLKQNDYANGFRAFADGCEYLLKTARNDTPFDVDSVSAQTAGGKPVIRDSAAMLTVEQVRDLSGQLKTLGDKYQCDVVLVTDTEQWYSDGDENAKRAYVNGGYGYRDGSEDRGGVLLFYSSDGQLGIYADGFGAKAFKGRGLYKFRQSLLSALYDRDDLTDVVKTYTAKADEYLQAASDGHPINPINWVPVLIAAAIGALLGYLPVSAMKRKLTDVYSKTEADSYLVPQSFQLTQNSDVLLNTRISRTVRVTETMSSGGGGGRTGGGGFHGGSSTHTSSSGGTHGGHSGKF